MKRTIVRRAVAPAALLILVPVLQAAPAGPEREPAELAELRTYPGLLLPGRTALIKAKQDEQVVEVDVRIGARVEQGQPLIRFFDAEERIEVKRAQAQLDQARSDYERMKRLHAEDQVSDELVEKSRTTLQLAEADLELARVRLEELSIRSPFDGLVAERYVDPGASVEIGDPLIRISSLGLLRLETLLPEELIPEVRQARQLTVHVDSTSASFSVPLRVGPIVVDPASGSFLLQIEIENPGERYVPGSSCRVSIGRSE